MDGSQVPTEWTHLKRELVPGVSDPTKRDVSLDKTDTASKKGPMSQNKDDGAKKMSKMQKVPDASKKLDEAKQSESGINRLSKKSSSFIGGDFSENVQDGNS